VRVVIVTMDDHLASATERARMTLRRELPGLELSLHSAAEWGDDEAKLARCREDIAGADIIIATMLFMDEQIAAVLPALAARREACDALVVVMSAGEVAKLTRMGRFDMGKPASGPLALLKKLRGSPKDKSAGAGAKQLKMLRRLPQILRFIPGTAQDVRAYFLTLQYWLAGSDDNVANMVRMLVSRYAQGPREGLRRRVVAQPPVEYPDVGLYHPALPGRIGEDATRLPAPKQPVKGRVGLLVMRSYVLAGNTEHYDAVIAALEARGLGVIPAFASGLDARPAAERFFRRDGQPAIDALLSLTGFSLVGGPAYNDSTAAEEMLAALDVPYVSATAVEFQTLEQWDASARGLLPVEQTMMVAIPELDGATGSMVYAGRSADPTRERQRDMAPHASRVDMLARRMERLVALRRKTRAERRVGVVLFNFPPNAGNAGTAAFLNVFASLFNTLKGLAAAGYTVEVPASVEALRESILAGNSAQHGSIANVHARISADEHVRRERYLAEIEAKWGPAPGRQQSDGRNIQVLGERFGNVFVGVQPGFGYEGDPMRLLFEHGFAPTHAFSAFYRWMKEDFRADVLLHFGTHGALEFMPGKQAGLSDACWPDRLIGDMPNVYLYAANNPSEGTLAKRRSAATLVSYLTPPVTQAGLYRGLLDLKSAIDRWRQLDPAASAAERQALALLIQSLGVATELTTAEPVWTADAEAEVFALTQALRELEHTIIPHGFHIVGEVPTLAERVDLLEAMAEGSFGAHPPRDAILTIAEGRPLPEAYSQAGRPPEDRTLSLLRELAHADELLSKDHEIAGIVQALDGRFVRPTPSGDLIRTPAILPTGRNMHGFDPFRIPSTFAVQDGARQAARLIQRHLADGHRYPESVALVLWGSDNLKSEGGPIAQALALIGAKPRFDAYGRLSGAELLPLASLDRPRIDVIITLSGIFRDLLPLQTRMLAEASWLAASVDEPVERNFIRKHALRYAEMNGCDLETAALRVFSNADSAYGANVNQLVESGAWTDGDELAETYSRRKSFAHGVKGKVTHQPALLQSMLSGVDLAYQNLESVELGVTTIDQYMDTLGGITRAVARSRGEQPAVYIGDQTRGEGLVRTLAEQVALETRTRTLNPKWYEGLLAHGYEGVRQIEQAVTNTMGWSATTGQVSPWVYQQITETFVLDEAMRQRLAELNPIASSRLTQRLIEASDRQFWTPDPAVLAALQNASDDLEDRLEGVGLEAAA
jgi:magnesium chelatase subunit H